MTPLLSPSQFPWLPPSPPLRTPRPPPTHCSSSLPALVGGGGGQQSWAGALAALALACEASYRRLRDSVPHPCPPPPQAWGLEKHPINPGRLVGQGRPEAAFVPVFEPVLLVPFPVSPATSAPLMIFWRAANIWEITGPMSSPTSTTACPSGEGAGRGLWERESWGPPACWRARVAER